MKIVYRQPWYLVPVFSILWSFTACDSSGENDESSVTDSATMRGIGDTGDTPDMGSIVDSHIQDAAPAESDMALVSPHCDEDISFGIRGELSEGVSAPSHSAQAVWSGTEWGIAWIQNTGDEEPNTVYFQRYNAQTQPIGEPAEIGRTEQGLLAVVSAESGYAVVYANARRSGDQYSGLRVRPIGPDGRPAVSEIDIEATFDVHSGDFKWAPFAGGMRV